MLAEPQPPGVGIRGPGGVSGLGQAAGPEPRERLRPAHHHQLDWLGERGQRDGRGRLAVDRVEVFQPRVGPQQDHRHPDIPLILAQGPLLDAPRGEGLAHCLVHLTGDHAVR